ncbi:MAG: hypothetical protein J0H68_06805 [Sphingobacteriia bacterium]|nr:hypothetical protein [Sphingobacteriia bacterium]
MSDINRSIVNSIESREYFKDAYEWYNFKYIYPVTQKPLITLFLLMYAFLAMIAYSILTNVSSKDDTYIFVSRIKDTVNQNSRLISLDHPISSQLAVADYLIKFYIKKYESYDYDQLDNQIYYIRNSSTRSVVNNFYKNIQIANYNSPINLYQKHTILKVDKINIQFLVNQFNNAEEAIVDFDVLTIKKGLEQINKVHKQILISFMLTDIEEVLNNQKPLIFQVREYKLYNNNQS